MVPSQTFQDHLKELRQRILWVVLAIGLSAGLAYILRTQLISILQRPLGAPLFYTSPAGSFNFTLKLSFVIGMFVALPVIIYQLLRFLEPALPLRVRRGLMIKIIGSSFLLAVAGVCFGFFLMIPMSLHFFLGYSTAQIKPLITADEYLSFVLNHLLTFALAFQIPMIFLFINRIKPLKPGKLLKYQRHVIVGSFALAIILPFTYDPLSQFIVAIPIVVLYYLSVVLLWFVNRGHKFEAELPSTKLQPATVPSPIKPVIEQPANHLSLGSIDGFNRSIYHARTNLSPLKVSSTASTHIKNNSVKPQKPRITGARLSIDGISPPYLA